REQEIAGDEPERDMDPGSQAVARSDARDAVGAERRVAAVATHIALITLVDDADLQEGEPGTPRARHRLQAHAKADTDLRLAEASPDGPRGLVATVRGSTREPCGDSDEGADLLAELRQVDVVRGPGRDRGLPHDLVSQLVGIRRNDRDRL